MSWVLLGHGYSNWMGGIFVNNQNVSLRNLALKRKIKTSQTINVDQRNNNICLKGTQLTLVQNSERAQEP